MIDDRSDVEVISLFICLPLLPPNAKLRKSRQCQTFASSY
jgi:hypothetical protein